MHAFDVGSRTGCFLSFATIALLLARGYKILSNPLHYSLVTFATWLQLSSDAQWRFGGTASQDDRKFRRKIRMAEDAQAPLNAI